MSENSTEHYNDAAYEVWRRGGNPDRLPFDRSENDFYNNVPPEATARRELKRQHVGQTCPDCGCKVYAGGCVNCNEENYL